MLEPTKCDEMLSNFALNFNLRLYNMACSHHVSPDQGLERVFFALEDSTEIWAGMGDHSVVLFDTTFATNRYGQKLGFFSTVAPDGSSVILAATLIQSESKESFEWAFERFRDTFSVPTTIYTDGCDKQKRAIETEFPGASHMLCVFHLSKNLFTHCKASFGNVSDGWRAFNSAWWKLAKNSDSRSKITFDGQWRSLVEMLPLDSDGNSNAVDWMHGLYEKRAKWAAAWTWGHFSAGMHSTQRCESVHKHFKTHLMANNLLIALGKEIVAFNKNNRERNKGKMERRRIQQQANTGGLLPPGVAALAGTITPFALDIVRAQAAQINRYAYLVEVCKYDPHQPELCRAIIGAPRRHPPQVRSSTAAAAATAPEAGFTASELQHGYNVFDDEYTSAAGAGGDMHQRFIVFGHLAQVGLDPAQYYNFIQLYYKAIHGDVHARDDFEAHNLGRYFRQMMSLADGERLRWDEHA